MTNKNSTIPASSARHLAFDEHQARVEEPNSTSKLPPAMLCQPAFGNLQQPSEKANWLRTPFFATQYPITGG